MADAAGAWPGAPYAAPSEADIARDIGRQVELMILEAKQKNEEKVGKEIFRVKAKLEQLGQKVQMVTERLQRLEAGTSGGLLKSELQNSIVKLEEVWESEVGMLKRELWQTIQAHNHNADLLKHHKDAIDQVTNRMTEGGAQPENEQAHAQLMQVNAIIQQETLKEQQMEELMHRCALVQQQIGMGAWPGMGPPDMRSAAAVQAAAAAQAAAVQAAGAQQAAAGAAAGRQKGQRGPQQKDKAKASAKQRPAKAMGGPPNNGGGANPLASLGLRADAAEFVPTGPPML